MFGRTDQVARAHPPVVEVRDAVVNALHRLEVFVGAHHAEVPQPEDLVLAVRDHIAAVTLCRDVGDALCVTDEYP